MKQVVLVLGLIVCLVAGLTIFALQSPSKGITATKVSWYKDHVKMAASMALKCREARRDGKELEEIDRQNCKNARRACEDSLGACEKYGYVY